MMCYKVIYTHTPFLFQSYFIEKIHGTIPLKNKKHCFKWTLVTAHIKAKSNRPTDLFRPCGGR